MPATSNEIQALRNFKDNIRDFISEEFSRYRSEYIIDKMSPDKEELKQNLRQYFNSEINNYLIASGLGSQFYSREKYEELKKKSVESNKQNDPELEKKIDAIAAPYLKCLDNLDKEIDKTSAAIIKNVEGEQKIDKIIKGTCIALGIIALGVATFFTAGAILGVPAIVAATYSIALACASSGILSAVKSGLSSSSAPSMFTSLLQSVGIMKKDDIELDDKTLNSLTKSMSHQVKMLPKEKDIEELKKKVAEITAPLSPDAIKHIPSKSRESTKQLAQDRALHNERINEASKGLTPREISTIEKMGGEMKKADRKVRDIALKQKRAALKHKDKIHSKPYVKTAADLTRARPSHPTPTPTNIKLKNANKSAQNQRLI